MEDEVIKSWNDKFHECLALEFSSPAYFKVHHIFVMTFMLQTGRYTDAYMVKVCALLEEFLDDPLTAPSKARMDEINSTLSSTNRENTIFRKSMGEIIDAPITILDVATDSPEHYYRDVVAWARAVLSAA